MIALINTFNAIENDSIGTVISKHRTVESAQEYAAKFQRSVKRSNGQSSYIPTRIVRLTRKHATGVHVHPMHAESVEA